ncbi:MAG: M15 family metallopeptidase [Actinobacteria bacterium]|nr:M15 family metallopeptidase [Actinomycetota bacterium]
MKIPHGRKELNSTYGKPYTRLLKRDLDWEADNLVQMPLPYLMRLAWNLDQVVSKVTIHRLVQPYLERALRKVWNHIRVEIKDEVGSDKTTDWYDDECGKRLRHLHLDILGGTFSPRPIRGTIWTPSTHWYGCAIDIDPLHNPMGGRSTLPLWFVDIFKGVGWTWGGTFKRFDPMHFQLATGV